MSIIVIDPVGVFCKVLSELNSKYGTGHTYSAPYGEKESVTLWIHHSFSSDGSPPTHRSTLFTIWFDNETRGAVPDKRWVVEVCEAVNHVSSKAFVTEFFQRCNELSEDLNIVIKYGCTLYMMSTVKLDGGNSRSERLKDPHNILILFSVFCFAALMLLCFIASPCNHLK